MKNDLIYQSTEYDCGPTTILNAIRFLFERKEIPPALIKGIWSYCNDTYGDQGHAGKRGTSKACIRYMATWLTGFGEGYHMPLRAEFAEDEEAAVLPGSRTWQCLEEGGTALIRCWSEGYGHYVLLTTLLGDKIGLFDPYFDRVHYLSEILRRGNCILRSEGIKNRGFLLQPRRMPWLY